VLNKSSNTWRRVPVPFTYSRLRSFGHWIGAIEVRTTAAASSIGTTIRMDHTQPVEVSPGAAKRASERIGPGYRLEPGLTVDDLFCASHRMGVEFPGELWIYNVETDV